MAYVWVGLLALVLLGGSAPAKSRSSAPRPSRTSRWRMRWSGSDAPDSRQDPSPEVVLDQRNLSFSPRVLAVRVGTTVSFPNHDRVFHDVFSFRDGKRFELGLYPVGAIKHVPFDRPGLSRVFCNIHPGHGGLHHRRGHVALCGDGSATETSRCRMSLPAITRITPGVPAARS